MLNIILLIGNVNSNVASSISPILSTKLTILTRPLKSYEREQGHAMVTRSVKQGLSQLNFPFNHNPYDEKEVGNIAVVLAHVNALAQAIELKKKGKIKYLLAGPNLVIWPTDDNKILASPQIDAILVPSHPTKHMYAEIEPSIKNRLFTWFAGIDPFFWNPMAKKKNKNVLIYWKNQNEGPTLKNEVVELLKKYNWNYRILEYGTYQPLHYKALLENVSFAVFLSRSESQGLALAEAWSMNVPTFVWNPKERTYRGRVYSAVSSCPYMTPYTGKDWKDISQLEEILQNIETILPQYSPREWVLNNMTDIHSAQRLLEIINIIKA